MAARRLRREATPAERRLWQRLRSCGPRFTRQLVIGDVVVDIACRAVRIAIELDGGHHAMQIAEDDERTAYLATRDWTVLRFWNSDVMENVDGVAAAILAAVARASTHPPTPPFQGGEVNVGFSLDHRLDFNSAARCSRKKNRDPGSSPG